MRKDGDWLRCPKPARHLHACNNAPPARGQRCLSPYAPPTTLCWKFGVCPQKRLDYQTRIPSPRDTDQALSLPCSRPRISNPNFRCSARMNAGSTERAYARRPLRRAARSASFSFEPCLNTRLLTVRLKARPRDTFLSDVRTKPVTMRFLFGGHRISGHSQGRNTARTRASVSALARAASLNDPPQRGNQSRAPRNHVNGWP
jgi:hypothetical protein